MSTFLTSDTHFGHKNICSFTNADGSKLRPWDNVDEMDEALIKNWNEVVKPADLVYHLGDFCFPLKSLSIAARLNGKKILIRGNHDKHKLKDYLQYFEDIQGCLNLDQYLLTHIPIHPESLGRWKANIHGHLHSSKVKATLLNHRDSIYNDPIASASVTEDARYINVSVEQTNFYPIAWEEAIRTNTKI